jgi:transglutaminase-like putative cysteine protease/predicted secreted protein
MEAVRAANRTRRPEDSVGLRVAILGAVMTGVVALAAEQAIGATTALAVLIVLPFAYWTSHVRRGKDNWPIKLVLTIGAIIALIRFLDQVQGVTSLDEVRFPLADIFLWVQVLHSFDLPQRKDLNFSLGSSLALMAVAGSVSQDLRFAVFLAIYFIFVVAALTLSYRSELEDGSAGWMRPRPRTPARRPTREIMQGAAATALAAAILFLVLPQPSGVRSLALPFDLGSGLGLSANDGIANPGFGEDDAGTRASTSSYYAFGDEMDLRVRGELSDQLVMRVRASAPAMWRGVLFDHYDGTSWTGDRSEPVPLGAGNPPYLYPPEFRSLGPRQEITQTFYVEAEQPSILFSGGQPDEVYYEGGVNIDGLGGLRTPATLTPGNVYSVVSSRGAARPSELRGAGPVDVPAHLARYLQVPVGVPARVRELARRITAGTDNQYDAVKAIERHLRTNYRYTIDSPVPPPGADAVDYFLFEDNLGFCEQFASATAIMLRTLGYPARVVAGYTTGTRNAFTGYYEVHGTDAHSWVEVWFPRLGWYEFDPTFDVPPAESDLGELLPIVKVVRFIADKLSFLVPGGGAGILRLGLTLVLVSVVLGGVAVVVRRRPRGAPQPGRAPPFTGGAVGMAFHRFEEALRAAGKPRALSETASELVARVAPPTEEARDALSTFERERYGYPPPTPAEAAVAAAALDRMASNALRHESPVGEAAPEK